jgi:hypothetical protein
MSYIYNTLYGIGQNNRIKEWNICVVDKINYSLITYSYCYLNGTKVECTKNIYIDKDTGHYQNAILYAQEKWKTKIESGYNTDIEIIKKEIIKKESTKKNIFII